MPAHRICSFGVAKRFAGDDHAVPPDEDVEENKYEPILIVRLLAGIDAMRCHSHRKGVVRFSVTVSYFDSHNPCPVEQNLARFTIKIFMVERSDVRGTQAIA
jgi:hypothetical protein